MENPYEVFYFGKNKKKHGSLKYFKKLCGTLWCFNSIEVIMSRKIHLKILSINFFLQLCFSFKF